MRRKREAVARGSGRLLGTPRAGATPVGDALANEVGCLGELGVAPVTIDAAGLLSSANDDVAALLGSDRRQLSGEPVRMVPLGPRNATVAWAVFEEAFEQGLRQALEDPCAAAQLARAERATIGSGLRYVAFLAADWAGEMLRSFGDRRRSS
jgi:hypothetical protein